MRVDSLIGRASLTQYVVPMEFILLSGLLQPEALIALILSYPHLVTAVARRSVSPQIPVLNCDPQGDGVGRVGPQEGH